MNFYYNKSGVGDTLIIDFLKQDVQDKNVNKHGDIAVMTSEDGTILGINIFNVSRYISISGKGKIRLDERRIEKLNRLLQEQGIDSQLEVDPRPDFVIGHVIKKEKHPNADKLSICQVSLGDEQLAIVCGAPNVEQGQKVVVARVGAVMPSGLVIKKSELRGVRSPGMICSARELGLPNAPKQKGILVLENDAPVGRDFWSYYRD